MLNAATVMYLNKHACRPCMYFEIIKTWNHQWSKNSCPTTNFVCLTASFLATCGFIKLFHKIPLFSMIIQLFFKFHDFSMHGTFFVFFQVFHDFQSLWEPCAKSDFWKLLITHTMGCKASKNQQTVLIIVCLCSLMLYFSVNNFSVMSEHFPGLNKD